MRVNHQWDLEYKELDDNFRSYRIESQQAQAENKSKIARLKHEMEKITARLQALEADYKQCQREKKEMKTRMVAIGEQLRSGHGLGNRRADVPHEMVSHKNMKVLEEKCQLLEQQVKAVHVCVCRHHCHYCVCVCAYI